MSGKDEHAHRDWNRHAVDMCVVMCVDMCVGMCIDMCINSYVDIFVHKCRAISDARQQFISCRRHVLGVCV